ncbi:putative myosin-binding protein 6 [Drosera capensis]
MATRSFRHFVEQEIGTFPHFVVYAILEWILIGLIFLDGFVAFVANEFAKLFELKTPCLFCTRVDHLLLGPDYCYNDSICEGHKKDVSSLAYCHVHRKLSDIRSMCEGCLLSFASESRQEAVGGNGNKNDQRCLFDDELRARLKVPHWVKDEAMRGEKDDADLCSCCGVPMKVKSTYQKGPSQTFASAASRVSQGPASSPRAAFYSSKSDVGSRNLDLPRTRYTDFKSFNSSTLEDEEGGNAIITGKGDAKAATAPLLEKDDLFDDALRTPRTPSFLRGNRFFGAVLSESPSASPKWAHRVPKKSLLDRVELASHPVTDVGNPNESEDSILNRLKRQVRLDRKSLIALYMELDEERSASAIAANNAMAMITRLQAEKAAVQMEAVQYQRMMEEQAEYDEEALQVMRDIVAKREEDIRELEDELDLYREKYGPIRDIDDIKQDPLDVKCDSFSSFTERSEQGSPHLSMSSRTEAEVEPEHETEVEYGPRTEHASSDDEKDKALQEDNEGKKNDASAIDFEKERSYLLGQLRMLESNLCRSADNIENQDTSEVDRVDGSDTSVAEEVSQIGKKLRALEADSRFLQHTFVALEKGGKEGSTALFFSGVLQFVFCLPECKCKCDIQEVSPDGRRAVADQSTYPLKNPRQKRTEGAVFCKIRETEHRNICVLAMGVINKSLFHVASTQGDAPCPSAVRVQSPLA